MYKNNILNQKNLEEEARKKRTYNANPTQKECPIMTEYYKSNNLCQHSEIIKKYLFNSHYFECKQCGKEV